MTTMKTAIEIGREVLAAKQTPLTKELTKVFVAISLAEYSGIPIPDEMKQTLQYKIINKRLELGGIDANEYVQCLLASVAENPGHAVLLCAAMAAIQSQHGPVDLKKLSELDAFGMGFPKLEDLHDIWESQKVHVEGGSSDNALDYPQTWKPLS